VPVAPLPEEERPILHECVHNQRVWFTEGNDQNQRTRQGKVDIVRRDNPENAYIIDHAREVTILNHPAPGWGRIFPAYRLRRVGSGLYRVPRDDEIPERVAIKCLNIKVVEGVLSQGSLENPYREISRMESIGDDIHFLRCIEAFRDKENIYIVTPDCTESLYDLQRLPEKEALGYFWQILDCLVDLRDREICHRNLSPTECLIYNGRVILTGLSRSFRLPPGASVVISDSHIHGKPAFQPPEVFNSSRDGFTYNAYQCDVWAAGMTLVYLLTGEVLYQVPHHTDLMFRCFFLARGINGEMNDLVAECFEDARQIEQEEFDQENKVKRQRHTLRVRQSRQLRPVFETIQQSLSPEVKNLLDNMFKVPPRERWNLDQVRSATLEILEHGTT